MTLIDPCLFLQSDAHPARSVRAMFTMQFDEGVASLLDMKVSERGAGANFSVDIAPGVAYVQGDSSLGNVPQTSLQGHYLCWNDAIVNDASTAVTSAPTAGNERYDRVVLEVQDNAEDASGQNRPRFRIVPGTPATIGTATPPALPNTAITLAIIGPIQNGTTTITDSLIVNANLLAGRRCAPGTIEWQAGSIVPSGWLACDGSAVSRTTYARLFAALGTQYGAGNGTTTFNLPDLRGKLAIAPRAGQAQVDTVGETGGEYTHTLTAAETPAHTHTMAHTHPIDPPRTNVTNPTGTSTFGAPYQNAETSITVGAATVTLGSVTNQMGVDIAQFTSGAASTSTTSSVGSGTAHNNMQPYQVVGVAVIRT